MEYPDSVPDFDHDSSLLLMQTQETIVVVQTTGYLPLIQQAELSPGFTLNFDGHLGNKPIDGNSLFLCL